MTRLEKILLFLLIFLIPSNLFYRLDSLSATTPVIGGILVDYLIPKLYLTDIIIFSLLFLWITKNHRKLSRNIKNLLTTIKHRSFMSSGYQLPLLIASFFLLTLAQTILTASNRQAALYFWFKLLEMLLLTLYLRQQKPLAIHPASPAGRHLLFAGLTTSVLWQSLLVAAQFLHQSSIFPYWFLGESQFSSLTPGIAKASFFGSLKVLPLGTTPHPNVLAGFISIALITIRLLHFPQEDNANHFNCLTITKYITSIFGICTLLLSQSLTAIVVFILANIIICLKQQSGTHKLKPLILIVSILCLGSLLYLSASTNILEYSSLSRRTKLNQIALSIIKDKPLGIGLNNFTAVMQEYGYIEATYRFLQPVHNIYLLLWTETSLIGLVIVILIFWQVIKKSLKTGSWQLVIPLTMMLIIGLADHYPLTLQQGQLMLALSIPLANVPYQNSNHNTAE